MLLQADRLVFLGAMGELIPGTVFAGHRIESVAGRGGMGVVYRATQLALDRTVALKVIAPGLLEDQNIRHRFVRESKVAASIDHPNVIPIYYAGEEQGIAYIAMRYVSGDDVRSLVRRERRLTPERAARIVGQTGAALDAAHAAGLVHRDIKPANVLLGPEDHVYLTDFGLTKHTLSVGSSTRPGHWVGTLDYVSPEQIRGDRVDARSDVYALGCLLFYVLTGRVPFEREGDEAKLWAHLSEPPPKASEHVPGVPAALDAVIERALAKQPDDRYPSAGDLARAARAAAAGRRPPADERLVARGAAAPTEAETVSAARPETITAVRPEPETVALRRSGRRPVLLAGALAAIVAAGAFAVIALGGGEEGAPRSGATPTPTPTAAPAAALHVARQITVGTRPNVVAVAKGNVFVGSFREPRMRIISERTGRVRGYAPSIGTGVADAVVTPAVVWLAISRQNRLVGLDAATGRPAGSAIALSGHPTSVAAGNGALWVGLIAPAADAPDQLVQIDPRTRGVVRTVPVPFGISAIATSPGAVWLLNRRRARLQRLSPGTGQIVRTLRVGSHRGEDMVYRDGALWMTNPEDDAVYKVLTATGAVIPISVGSRPRKLAIGGDRIYVTSYNSSDLREIDARSSRVVGSPLPLPVNPFAVAAGRDAVWVASQPDDVVSEVRGRGG